MSKLSEILEEDEKVYVFFIDSHHYFQFGIVDNIEEAECYANEIYTERECGSVYFVIKGFGCDLQQLNKGILDFGDIKPKDSYKILVVYNTTDPTPNDDYYKVKELEINEKNINKIKKIVINYSNNDKEKETIDHIIIGKKLNLIEQKHYIIKE